MSVVISLLKSLDFVLRSRAALHLEIIALRHQLAVVNRSRRPRLRLTPVDRMLWAWLSHSWRGWRSAIHIVKPETVIAWHRQGFLVFWTWKSRHRGGRPAVSPDVRALIREMSTANRLWGAPRIHGELLKLGIAVSESPSPRTHRSCGRSHRRRPDALSRYQKLAVFTTVTTAWPHSYRTTSVPATARSYSPPALNSLVWQ